MGAMYPERFQRPTALEREGGAPCTNGLIPDLESAHFGLCVLGGTDNSSHVDAA